MTTLHLNKCRGPKIKTANFLHAFYIHYMQIIEMLGILRNKCKGTLQFFVKKKVHLREGQGRGVGVWDLFKKSDFTKAFCFF